METQANQPRKTQGITKKHSNNQHHSKTDNNTEITKPYVRYDDGLQKAAHPIEWEYRHLEESQTTVKQDEENLERSYEETRRSSVQIRPTPPKLFLTKKPLLSI